MATDTLSDVLKTVRLTGAAYFDVAAQDPWSVHSPARDLILPRILPGADHLIAYHVVTAGRCFARLEEGEAVPLEAGEVVVFTNADPHVMSSNAGMRAEPPTADMIEIADAGLLPFRINLMNGGAVSARLVCGYLACDAKPFNPLLEALPPMLKAGDKGRNDNGWLGQFIHFAVAEVAEKRAGSESVLTKLSELMFIDVVRRYIEALPAQNAGWLAGLRDPAVGKALALIHARPSFNGRSRDWRDNAARRARSWPSDSCSSSACRRCTIWPNGACRLPPRCSVAVIPTWRRSQPRSVTNPRPPSAGHSRR